MKEGVGAAAGVGFDPAGLVSLLLKRFQESITALTVDVVGQPSVKSGTMANLDSGFSL
jgi:hypothetical protein